MAVDERFGIKVYSRQRISPIDRNGISDQSMH